jgi:hypothetical protein
MSGDPLLERHVGGPGGAASSTCGPHIGSTRARQVVNRIIDRSYGRSRTLTSVAALGEPDLLEEVEAVAVIE